MKSSHLTSDRLQPPLHLLHAFCAVVRFGSVTAAAASLHMSQSAVTKQIQELEYLLGTALFERAKRRLTPTAAALRYEAAVRQVLARLEAATLECLTHDEAAGTLRLAAAPTFSARWLIARLADFARAHPRITLHFVPYLLGADGRLPAEADCAIAFGDGHWPQAQTHYLAGRELTLIAAPQMAAQIRGTSDIARVPRLHHISVPEAWQRWASEHYAHDLDVLRGSQFDQFTSIVEAVQAGLGVALVPRVLVADEIARGLLVEPLGAAFGVTIERGYWLCYPSTHANMGALRTFCRWLLEQAETFHTQTPRR